MFEVLENVKMWLLLVLTVCLTGVTAGPYNQQRIVGGTVTDIETYPYGTSLLFSWSGDIFSHSCGGTIMNYRTVLSAAHCFIFTETENWRIRVGSTYVNSGGVVHIVQRIVNHPSFNLFTLDNDISLLRSATNFIFNNNVRAASFAGANYNLPDNSAVWAIGWGTTAPGGNLSEQLRHVEIWVVNLEVCRSRYAEIGLTVTDNMLCSGWLDVGGRDQCQGDSGGPLVHNNVIVGICSWGESCAMARYPGVNVRVSRYSSWIQSNV